ncbi:hypothetical protein QUB37_29485 [Microcoleus sp. AT3-A2]
MECEESDRSLTRAGNGTEASVISGVATVQRRSLKPPLLDRFISWWCQ